MAKFKKNMHMHTTEKKNKGRHSFWKCCTAAVLAVVLAASVFPASAKMSIRAETIAKAKYPKMAAYPDESSYIKESGDFDSDGFSKAYDAWNKSRRRQLDQPEGYADGLESFYRQTMRQFLSGAKNTNRIYSPLNVYMALGMLAEMTAKDSRRQVLDLLGSKNMQALRTQASALWNANYCDDGAVSSLLASSLWLSKDVKFKQSTLDQIADTYYASSYRGKMGSDAFNKTFRNWLNKQTGGLLKKQVAQTELSSDTILALATTIYFRAKWHDEFSKSSTSQDVFHAISKDIKCSFMHQSDVRSYYWGNKFTAAAQSLEKSGAMWFILPEKGVSIDELLADKQLTEFILAGNSWKNSKSVHLNLSVPKFDVNSSLDLREGLKKMGVIDVFNRTASDFSSISSTQRLYVSKASHDARVKIDEEGCSAAAYTVIAADGAGIPESEEEVDFVLNRPFLFVITGASEQPLFVGVVNQP
ncbi:MAG: hypothetical protein K2N87_05820 [Eubacterium sp.]|nr:hypothetical protein [Eubacterium sp.]